MKNKMHSVTGRVRAMRINNNVLPAYHAFCRRNYDWLSADFPIDDPDPSVPEELWIRRRLKDFREEEAGGGDSVNPVLTFLVFMDEYVMGIVRITMCGYDIDSSMGNLISHVEFCVDGKFRGGDASVSICDLAIRLAFGLLADDEIVVVYPKWHKAMPSIMSKVLGDNPALNGVAISGLNEDGEAVDGYRITKRGELSFGRNIGSAEAKEVFG